MKIKVTKKDIKNNYFYIVRAGYCELQTLLRAGNVREFGYACGVYGWNWDAYEIEATDGSRVCVCTGYRDMTGERIEGIKKFEENARKIWDWNNKKYNNYEKREKAAKKLVKKFADFIIKNIIDKNMMQNINY